MRYAILLLFALALIVGLTFPFQNNVLAVQASPNNPDITENSFGNDTNYGNGTHIQSLRNTEYVLDYIDQNNKPHYTNHKFSQGSHWITEESAQVTFTFDNQTCAGSVFHSGRLDNSSAILQSDKWIVKGAVNGTSNWNSIPSINNAQCNTSVIQNSTGTFLTVTKSANNVGTFVQIWSKPLGQPLKVSLIATNQNPAWTNNKVGFSEIIQVPRIITLGNQTYDLSQYNNTVLNRAWVINHKSQLLDLTNKINYDMSGAFQYFSQITILWNGTQASLVFDYTNIKQTLPVNASFYLDPIYQSTSFQVITGGGSSTSTSCPGATNEYTSGSMLEKDVSSGAGTCRVVSFIFPVSTIPLSSIVKDVKLQTDVTSVTNGINCDIVSENTYTGFSNSQASALFTAITGNTAHDANDAFCATTGNKKVIELGSNPASNVQSALSSGYYDLGIRYNSMTRDASQHLVTFANPQITIIYNLGGAPSAPTSFSVTPGKNTETLSYSAPLNMSGQTQSKERIDRVQGYNNALLQEPFLDNGGVDNSNFAHAFNFSGAKLLLHNDAFELNYSMFAYYPFQNTTNDFSASNTRNDLALATGSAFYQTGKFGTAFDFRGTNFLDQSGLSFDALTKTQPFTVSLWVKNTITASDVAFTTDQASQTTAGWSVWQKSADHKTYFRIYDGTTAYEINSLTSTNDGNWHYVTATYDGSSNRSGMKLYIDGNLEATGASLAISGNFNNGIAMYLGEYQGGTDKYTGFMDEVKFFYIALNQNQVNMELLNANIQAKDHSGNNVQYYGVNIATRQNGKINQAFGYDNASSLLNITSSNLVQGVSDFTYLGWYNAQDNHTVYLLSWKKTATTLTNFLANATHLSIFTDTSNAIVQNKRTDLLIPTFADPLISSTNWVIEAVDNMFVDTAQNQIQLTAVGISQGSNMIHRTIPPMTSAETWKFNYTWTNKASGTIVMLMPMFSSSSKADDFPSSSADQLGVQQPTTTTVRICYTQHSGSQTCSSSITVSTSTTYYLTLAKTSSTSTSLYVFSDKARTTQVAGSPVTQTIPSNFNTFTSISFGGQFGQTGSLSSGVFSNLVLNYNPYGWHMFAFERNGNTWRTFFDGSQIGSNVTNSANLGSPFNSAYIIGAKADTGSNNFGGYTDEILIMPKALTSTQINDLYFRGSGTYTNISTTSNLATYTDSGLTNGQVYCYRVYAQTSSSVNSTYTNAQCGTVFTIPGAPTGLTATRTSTQVNLSYVAPSSNGGTPIGAYYKVRQNGTDPNYYEAPLFTKNLRNLWKLDGNLNYTDFGTKKDNLTLTSGTANFVTSQIYQGFSYDGSTYHSAPNESDFDFDYNTPFSLSFYVKTNTASNMIPIAKGSDSDYLTNGFGTLINSAGNPYFALSDPTHLHRAEVHWTTNIANNKPQLLTWTYNGNGSSKGISLYVNGTLRTLTIDQDNLASNSIQNNLVLTLGAGSGGFGKFTGVLDDVRIFNSTLSQSQVTLLSQFTTTSGLSQSDTNIDSSTIYNYKVYAVNQVGQSSSMSNITTAYGLPSAPQNNNCIAYTVGNITCTYQAPSTNGGTPITSYQISRNGTIFVNSTGNTNLKWTDTTSYLSNHQESYCIHAWNIVGNSTCSNTSTVQTSEFTKGNFYINGTVVGDAFGTTPRFNLTLGLPLPTIKWEALLNGSTVIINNTLNVTPTKFVWTYLPRLETATLGTTNSTFSVKIGITNSSFTSIMQSNSTIQHRAFDPSYQQNNGLTYNYTDKRYNNGINLQVNVTRHASNWDIKCNYFNDADSKGFWINQSSGAYFSHITAHSQGDTVYVRCYDPDTYMFTIVSFGNSTFSLPTAFTGLKSVIGDWMGVPIAFLFVLMIAGIATKQNSSTFIIILLATLGIMAGIGFFTISTGTWALLMIIGILSVLGAKQYYG